MFSELKAKKCYYRSMEVNLLPMCCGGHSAHSLFPMSQVVPGSQEFYNSFYSNLKSQYSGLIAVLTLCNTEVDFRLQLGHLVFKRFNITSIGPLGFGNFSGKTQASLFFLALIFGSNP